MPGCPSPPFIDRIPPFFRERLFMNVIEKRTSFGPAPGIRLLMKKPFRRGKKLTGGLTVSAPTPLAPSYSFSERGLFPKQGKERRPKHNKYETPHHPKPPPLTAILSLPPPPPPVSSAEDAFFTEGGRLPVLFYPRFSIPPPPPPAPASYPHPEEPPTTPPPPPHKTP